MTRAFRRIAFGLAAAAAGLLTGCAALQAVTEAGTAVAVGAGVMTPEQAQSANNAMATAAKAAETLTPEQEYYVGRAVGATLLATYRPANAPPATRYLNTLGQALALVSDLPQTFGGYHFLILDADEVNAFAAPGGLIFVSRGMLRCCRSESALAAVLAHEIGHIQHRHGLASIRKGRITQATVTVLAEAGKTLGGNELKQVADQFQGAVTDIAQTLIVNGYSRQAEREADAAAVAILQRMGYNPAGLVAMLEEMKTRVTQDGPGFGKTHPPPEARIADLRDRIGVPAPIAEPAAMKTRFAAAMRDI